MYQVHGAMSAAQHAFHCRNHHADYGVCHKAVVNPVPGEPDHQKKVARRQDLARGWTGARGGNGERGKNDSHGAVWPAGHRWNQ